MKIIVFGAGAIGSLYGAKLSKLNDVTLVGRQKHVDLINKNGLKITGIEKNIYKLNAATEIGEIEDNTLILLTTKVHDSKKAIEPIKNLIKKDTIILCLQNGLFSEEIVKEIVKEGLVLRGITNIGAVFLEPGTVQFNSPGYTAIEDSEKSEELAENFNKCGFKTYVSKEIKEDIWKKLVVNCIINSISAILRVESRELAGENLDPLKRLIADECLEVAEKEGIKFDIDFVRMINELIKGSKNRASMQQDLIKGKKTEIEYLNGAVVKLGKKYGIKCPVNEALVVIIKEMEKSKD